MFGALLRVDCRTTDTHDGTCKRHTHTHTNAHNTHTTQHSARHNWRLHRQAHSQRTAQSTRRLTLNNEKYDHEWWGSKHWYVVEWFGWWEVRVCDFVTHLFVQVTRSLVCLFRSLVRLFVWLYILINCCLLNVCCCWLLFYADAPTSWIHHHRRERSEPQNPWMSVQWGACNKLHLTLKNLTFMYLKISQWKNKRVSKKVRISSTHSHTRTHIPHTEYVCGTTTTALPTISSEQRTSHCGCSPLDSASRCSCCVCTAHQWGSTPQMQLLRWPRELMREWVLFFCCISICCLSTKEKSCWLNCCLFVNKKKLLF